MKSIAELYMFLESDLGRYLILMRRKRIGAILRLIVYSPGIWITFLYRIGRYLHLKAGENLFLRLLTVPYNILYFVLSVFTGLNIPIEAVIGKGLYIGHWGGVTIHPQAVIGKNLNLSQGVTIGESGRGDERGVPVIGDNVYIGPGAKVFGKIVIGNNVAIGANAVVNKSVPDNAVVGGIPAVILNYRGSGDFVITGE
ncbi:MAG: hypothetical protein A2X93_07215 [Deltaproteobacteria bacterium GWC2_56_8]|nr:MAG: hypothetical protein A2X99_11995 [Deltaproteobacteria bacterium GWB2_55_19]OGP39012.1 MAG: hypothetical protein A2X93_07215 [Deltaproteobacteria bacterium GWC2_56_8]